MSLTPEKRQAPATDGEQYEVRPRKKRAESVRGRYNRHYNKLRVELQKTVSGRYRNGHSSYDKVGVLLICWEEDDLDVWRTEIRRLEQIFKQRFHFEVEQYRIPAERSATGLNAKISEFAHRYDSPNNLGIVYYGGHGANEDNRLKLFAKAKSTTGGNPSMFFDGAVRNLQECNNDVLVITDCCYAALAFSNVEMGLRKFELLTATGLHEETYAPQNPQSFTRILCNTLEALSKKPRGFTTSQLYRELYHNDDLQRKPFLFDQSKEDWGRISLQPLLPSTETPQEARFARSQDGDAYLDMELRLCSTPIPQMMNELARMMRYLPHVKDIKFRRLYAPKIELQGFMRHVLLIMRLRPLLEGIRERRQLKLARLQSQGKRPSNSAATVGHILSPSKLPEMFNWDKARLEEGTELESDAADTPPPPDLDPSRMMARRTLLSIETSQD